MTLERNTRIFNHFRNLGMVAYFQRPQETYKQTPLCFRVALLTLIPSFTYTTHFLTDWKSKSNSKLFRDRQSVGQFVLLSGIHLGTYDQIFIAVWHLWFSTRGAPSCYWALPALSFLGPIFAELVSLSYCLIWDSPNREGQGPIFSQSKMKVQVILRLTDSQPVSFGDRYSSGTRNQFLFFFFQLSLDSLRIYDEGSPLWLEVGSVVFSCCWASPAQSFSGLSPTGLMSLFDFIVSISETPIFIQPFFCYIISILNICARCSGKVFTQP
jgi:hypothetical protein